MRAARLGELRFNLLSPSPLALSSMDEPLRLASTALQKKFLGMLDQHGFAPSQLAAALLVMWFPTEDDYYCVATRRLETEDGRVYEKSSSASG